MNCRTPRPGLEAKVLETDLCTSWLWMGPASNFVIWYAAGWRCRAGRTMPN